MNGQDQKRLKSFIANFGVTDVDMVEVPMYKKFDIHSFKGNSAEYVLERDMERRVKMTISLDGLMKVIDILEMFAYRDTNQATKEAFDNFLLIQRMSRTYDSIIT